MAEQTVKDLCEEPDADFFDTFFDDGVLETIGAVLGDQRSVSDDSSCELVEEPIQCSKNPSSDVFLQDKHNVPPSQTFETPNEKPSKSKHPGVIVLKSAQINDILRPSNEGTRKSRSDLCANTSEKVPKEQLPIRTRVVTEEIKLPCSIMPQSAEDAEKCVAKGLNESKRINENRMNVSIDELFSRVHEVLKASQLSGSDPNHEVRSKEIGAEKKVADPAGRNESSSSVKHILDLCRKNVDTPSTTNIDNTDKTSNLSEKSTEGEKNGGDKKETKVVHSSCFLSTFKATEIPPKSTSSGTESKASRDDTEKENDLDLEDTVTKIDSFLPKKKKINILLRSQILASKTILNSGSSSNSELRSSSPGKSEDKGLPADSSVRSSSSQSSLSDKSSDKIKSQKDKRKSKRDRSTMKESSDHKRMKRRSSERYEKLKRSTDKDDSPPSRRSRDHNRSSRKRRRRSRSGSESLSHLHKKQSKRASSPHRSMRDSRRRSFSRSPSSSSSRHYGKRLSQSPTRQRSRSRSHSSIRYRTWKSPSPSTQRRRRQSPSPSTRRRRQSPSPSTRRRRNSRSRSRSPFINEICRLKKQWEREDRKKGKACNQPELSSEIIPSRMPSVATWHGNSMPAHIISNTLSVSVEAVQVHSSSFAFGSSMGCPNPGFLAGPPALVGPHVQSTSVMRPDYSMCNNISTHVPSVRPVAPQPEIPGLSPPPCPQDGIASCEFRPSLPICESPKSLHGVPQPPQITMQPQSVLRKQLDILMSTVVNFPVPHLSSDKSASVGSDRNQPAANFVREPPNAESFPPACESNSEEPRSENLKSANQLSPKVLNEVGSNNLLRAGKAENSRIQAASQSFLPAVQVLMSQENSNSSPCEKNSSQQRGKFSEQVPFSMRTEALKQIDCSSNVGILPKKSGGTEHCPGVLNTSKNLPTKSLELSKKVDLKQQTESSVLEMEEGITIEEYDSDVIIEEAPPKPAIELVCLSCDEAEADEIDTKKDKVVEKVIMSDIIQNISEHSCEKPSSAEQLNLQTSSTGPREEALSGILSDISSEELYCIEPSQVEPQQSESPKLNKTPLSKRKRKRRARAEERKKEKALARKKYAAEKDKNPQNSKQKSDCGPTSVISECREMIDSLRTGRFVIEEDKVPEQGSDCVKSSNSPLNQSSLVQFAYTKSPDPVQVPTSKEVATNTPIRLCIDVCIGTGNSAALKECMTQTDLNCLECAEKKNLIRKMNAQLLSMKKELDDLRAIVNVRRAETPSQMIPGLDFSTSDVQTPSGNKPLLPHLKSPECSMYNVLTQSTSASSISTTAQISNNFSTRSTETAPLGEPVLAYDYNHSSPVRTVPQSQTESYLVPKRPFQ